jgi:crotonobetaine/carnitine-CoA ligase
MNQIVRHLDAGAQWSGVNCQTIIEMVDKACRKDPNKPTMIFEEGLAITRRDFLERVEKFAGYIVERVKPGESVALMLENRLEFMVALFGVIAARGVLVSINPTARVDDAGHIMRDSAIVLAIAGEAEAKVLREVPDCPSLKEIVVVEGGEPSGLNKYAGKVPLQLVHAKCERDDIANIYYTSGTTGRPKGCMLHHGWWLRVCDIHIRLLKLTPQDRSLCCLPFYYADPAFLLLCSLHTGGTLITMRRFSVSRFWKVVSEHGVTEMLLFSSMVILLLKAEPTLQDRNHKVRVSISVAVPPAHHKEFVERYGIPILDNYGSTEATINTRIPLSLHDEMMGSGSMGVAMPECELRIVDDNDHDVSIGTVGELLVKAPDMFRGYLHREEAFAETMRGGWFHSGDLAKADERGFYYFMGRKKDIIRRSHENIAATEVEDVLRQHPKVLEAAVIAVPDPIRGEEVKAYVLLTEGNSRETLPPEEIIAHCEARLARFKVPRYIEYRLEDFPRTPSMRVLKEALKLEKNLVSNAWDREKVMPTRSAGSARS